MAPPPSTPATDAVASIEMRSLMSASSDLELDDDLSDFSPMSTSMSTPTKSHATPGVGTSSPRAVAVNMFISFVGAGILSLPAAFKISGWFLSTLCLTTVCALAIKCMLLLMEVRRRLEEQGHGAVNGYGDVGRILFGFYGEKLVDVCLVVSQMGFATAYIIFVSKNVFSLTKEKIPLSMTSFLCVPILSYLVCLRSMKSLSPFSLVADCANILGLAIVFVQDVHFYPLDHDEIVAANWDQALYILSIAVYCFEGVGLILPLESSAADRAGFPKLLIKVISAITILMVVFGIAGYLGFGDATASPITDNMSGGSATVVKVSLCVGLYLTYPIMMFPVSTVLENAWLERKEGEGEGEYSRRQNLFRFWLVCSTAFVAWAVPDFGVFISFVGASICMILGFILPAVFHLKTFPDQRIRGKVTDWAFVVFGCVFGVLGTMQSGERLVAVVLGATGEEP